MPDVEKSLGEQPPPADNIPNKVKPEEPSSDDADSFEIAENKPDEEKKSGVKDYFVIGESEHLC